MYSYDCLSLSCMFSHRRRGICLKCLEAFSSHERILHMDPVSLALITAIEAGVTSSITDATKASLVAGYTALKKRLLEKINSLHPKVPQALAELEATPTSQARQAVLVEEITATDIPR